MISILMLSTVPAANSIIKCYNKRGVLPRCASMNDNIFQFAISFVVRKFNNSLDAIT